MKKSKNSFFKQEKLLTLFSYATIAIFAPIHKLDSPTPPSFPHPPMIQGVVRTLGRYIHGISRPQIYSSTYISLCKHCHRWKIAALLGEVEKHKNYREGGYISRDGLSGLCQNSSYPVNITHTPPTPPHSTQQLRFQPQISSRPSLMEISHFDPISSKYISKYINELLEKL